MKRMLAGSFLAATFAVGLSAQTTPPQTTPPSQPPTQPPAQESRAAGDAKIVTVIGCLKAGDAADSYTLSDLKWSKDKASGAVGTSGSAAPPAAVASATTIKVIPSGSTKLSEHVGHTVEVSGSIADKMDRPSSTTAPPSEPAGAARSSASSAAPALEVKTVKMVSATCTPQ